MKVIELNKMVGEYLGLANFYLEDNEIGKPRWKYMDKDRMIYIFRFCMSRLESENILNKIENTIKEIRKSMD